MKQQINHYPIFREAKVISTKDSKNLGRVQVKVFPELQDIPDSDCPYAFPLGAGVHGKDFSLPKENSIIYVVVFNRFWTEIAFIPSVIPSPKEQLFDAWISSKRSQILDMKETPQECHFDVKEWEDGFTQFHDTQNNEHGFLHPQGTYVTINKEGQISIQSVKKLSFHNKEGDVKVSIDSTTGAIEIQTKDEVKIKTSKTMKIGHSTDTVGTMISKLLDILVNFTTVGSPANHFTSSTSKSQLNELKSKWQEVFN